MLFSSKETDVKEISNLRLVIESMRKIVEISANIAEIVLNMTVKMVLEQKESYPDRLSIYLRVTKVCLV